MGPLATAEGRHWGHLNLKGGTEATRPRWRNRDKRRVETIVRAGARAWARAIQCETERAGGAMPCTRNEEEREDTHAHTLHGHGHAQVEGGMTVG